MFLLFFCKYNSWFYIIYSEIHIWLLHKKNIYYNFNLFGENRWFCAFLKSKCYVTNLPPPQKKNTTKKYSKFSNLPRNGKKKFGVSSQLFSMALSILGTKTAVIFLLIETSFEKFSQSKNVFFVYKNRNKRLYFIILIKFTKEKRRKPWSYWFVLDLFSNIIKQYYINF